MKLAIWNVTKKFSKKVEKNVSRYSFLFFVVVIVVVVVTVAVVVVARLHLLQIDTKSKIILINEPKQHIHSFRSQPGDKDCQSQ